VQFLVIAFSGEAERVEIGVQVAAHSVSADHHQGPDGVPGFLVNLGVGYRCALGLGFLLDLFAKFLLDGAPVAVKRVDEIAVGFDRPVLALPRSPARFLQNGFLFVLEGSKEVPPFGIDRIRVRLVLSVEVFDIGCVGAVKQRRQCEYVVRFLPCHVL